MKFKISPEVIEMFPDVKIGILIGEGLDNQSSHAEISTLLKEEQSSIRDKISADEIASLSKIKDWREAYRKFGFKPSSYRSSIEALIRRILRGKELPNINSIVDLYNLISVKYLVPVGADDIAHVEEEIQLAIADGSEHFIKLGSDQPEEIARGEVVYKDAREVLCRCWNYRECDKSKITQETQKVCVVIEGLQSTSKEEISRATSELESLLSKFCGGSYRSFFLDKNHPETVL